MFILSPNPSVPRSCPSVQVSAASDLPVHHEVAFVQLWPHLFDSATVTQPISPPGWATSEAPDTLPFDLNLPPPTLPQPNSDLSKSVTDLKSRQL